jgi:tetratricopeptide (TPR) repeat protein
MPVPRTLPEALRLAFALEGQGRTGEAAQLLQGLLQAHPGHAGALEALGRLHLGAGDFPSAERWLRRAYDAGARHPGVKAQLASALLAQGNAEEALLLLEQCLAAAPRGELHAQASAALRQLGRFEEARVHLDEALRLAPASADVLLEEADLARDLGREEAAFAAVEAAHFRHPRDPYVRDRYALALLGRGVWGTGWALYEGRKAHPAHPLHPRSGQPPVWDGTLTPGLRLLVVAEQGVGDVLQFLRFPQRLARRGLHVRVEFPPDQLGLAPLLEAQGDGVVYGFDGRVPPPIHAQEALMSLPHRLGLSDEAGLGEGAYLRADPERAGAWRDLLGPKRTRLRAGLVWAGNPAYPFDARRSLPPEHLAPLLALEDVDWVSLQKGTGRFGTAPEGPPGRWFEAGPKLVDYGETAAALANLDVLVSIDTGVAHLAGAMGIPTLLLLPRPAEWRWMEGREDSPWYAGHQLLRQTAPGDWQGVVREAAARLQGLVAG